MWIHWWSPVASANRSMRSWSTVIQSLTADSWPTRACRSASVVEGLRHAAVTFRRRSTAMIGCHCSRSRSKRLERHVPQRQAVRGQVHVVLRVAQEAEHRHARALSRKSRSWSVAIVPSRVRMPTIADLHLVAAPVRQQLAHEVVRGVDVEDARLQRHQHLVGELHHLVEALAVQAGGRVEHHVRRALGRAHDVAVAHLPGADRAAGPAGRSASQVRADCWRSTSPSITAWPRRREVARHVGRQRALADARPSGLATTITGMQALPVAATLRVMLAAPARRAIETNQRHAATARPCRDRRRAREPTSWSSSPTRSWSSRASTGALMRGRALAGAPRGRVERARPVRALPRLPDRRRRRAGRARRGASWSSGSTRSTGTACRR